MRSIPHQLSLLNSTIITNAAHAKNCLSLPLANSASVLNLNPRLGSGNSTELVRRIAIATQ